MNNERFAQRQAVRPLRNNEVWYRARLLNIVKTARAAIEPELRKFIKAAIKSENQQLAHHLALTARNIVQSAAHRYMTNADVTGINTQAPRIASRAATQNLDAVDRQLTRLIAQHAGIRAQFPKPLIQHGAIVSTVHVGTGDAAKIIQFPPTRYGSQQKTRTLVEQQIANNVQLIKSIPEQYFDRIADDIYENVTTAQRWEVLADKLYNTLDDDLDITRNRANLIARDQTAKMNSAFNEDRQTSIGITHYQWQTAGDERVRETHAANDGEVFAWDDPPAETGHPGEDVNCRCVALAQFAELEEAA